MMEPRQYDGVVVDEESMFRRDLRSGRLVMEFALSAPAALEPIPDPPLILILSDINMPGMTGLKMLPKVKAVRPNVPVIMITAYGTTRPERGRRNSGQPDCFLSPSTSAYCAKKSTSAWKGWRRSPSGILRRFCCDAEWMPLAILKIAS